MHADDVHRATRSVEDLRAVEQLYEARRAAVRKKVEMFQAMNQRLAHAEGSPFRKSPPGTPLREAAEEEGKRMQRLERDRERLATRVRKGKKRKQRLAAEVKELEAAVQKLQQQRLDDVRVSVVVETSAGTAEYAEHGVRTLVVPTTCTSEALSHTTAQHLMADPPDFLVLDVRSTPVHSSSGPAALPSLLRQRGFPSPILALSPDPAATRALLDAGCTLSLRPPFRGVASLRALYRSRLSPLPPSSPQQPMHPSSSPSPSTSSVSSPGPRPTELLGALQAVIKKQEPGKERLRRKKDKEGKNGTQTSPQTAKASQEYRDLMKTVRSCAALKGNVPADDQFVSALQTFLQNQERRHQGELHTLLEEIDVLKHELQRCEEINDALLVVHLSEGA